MKMSACTLFNEPKQRTEPPKYWHMICIGKTKCTSEKGLLSAILQYVSSRSLWRRLVTLKTWNVPINPLTAEWALRALIDFTQSNVRRFYSSIGNPLDGKGLTIGFCQVKMFEVALQANMWVLEKPSRSFETLSSLKNNKLSCVCCFRGTLRGNSFLLLFFFVE